MEPETSSLPTMFLTLGAILAMAPWLERAGARTNLPRVTLYLLLGVLVGPLALDAVPAAASAWYPPLAEVALAMVGFLVGSEFKMSALRSQGRAVASVSLIVSLGTGVLVSAGIYALSGSVVTALILGTAAVATDPAAVDTVTRDLRADGPNTNLLRRVVGADDVWALLFFAISLALVQGLIAGGEGTTLAQTAIHIGRELGGSILVGGLLGGAMAGLTGRVSPGEPLRLEALGFVMLACGAASYFDLSYLLTTVVMGAMVANVARHHDSTFREIESLEQPFLVLFFVLSGATAKLDSVAAALPLIAGFVILRTLGRWLTGAAGVAVAGEDELRKDIGLALLPQAGVALGMTLVAVDRVPELTETVLPAVVVSTIVFEAVGPVLTARFVKRAGEAGALD